MQIVRFDDEVSIPIAAFGSQFRLGPLVGDDSRARVALIRLAAGGSVGRHPAASTQLFAVVAGSVWVRGGDGAGRTLDAGYGALWEAGEEHEAHSPDGATVVCIEGELDVWALMVTGDIEVADHDPQWPQWFAAVAARVWPAVADVAVRIDHVGSTSVPGLAAKPIIDMDIVVASPDDVAAVAARLAGIGYRWRGDLGVTGRESFRPPAEPDLPRHHLYVVVENNRAHLDHWLLRDLLRADESARERYGALKRRNAELADGDMDVYVAAKARLVTELLTRARDAGGWPPVEYWLPDTAGSDRAPAPDDRSAGAAD
ncbi:MAG TPA: GrpB family protein [Ilumatobacteraceae bacterium]|nr:GrpB family protein [Ilumatobacteraceae bacterium]